MTPMPRSSSTRTGASARIELEGDRIEHELDVGDRLRGRIARSVSASSAGSPLERRRCVRWVASPWRRPVPPGQADEDARPSVRPRPGRARPRGRPSSTSARSGGDARRPVLDVVVPGVPRVGVGHRGPQHPRPDRADHQRRAGRPRAARQQLAVARLVPAAVEVDGALAQERPDDRERLLEPVDPVVEREAEGAELGLVPAGAEAEHEPAAAELVDRGGLLGEQRRVVEVRAGDERPELDPRGRRGDRRQRASRPPTARAPDGPPSDRAGARRPRPSRSRGPRSRGSCRAAPASGPRARPRGAGCRP